MISEIAAVEIARKAIEGKLETQEGWPITVKLKKGRFVVTFERVNEPGVDTADYDARVTIDSQTGEVIEILGGS